MVRVKTHNPGEIIPGEIYGQYNWDLIHGNEQDPDGQREARDMPAAGMHSEGLWDEEDFHIPDTATGRVATPPNELTDNLLDETSLDHIADSGELSKSMGMKGDLTAQWIAAIEAGDTELAGQIEAKMLGQ